MDGVLAHHEGSAVRRFDRGEQRFHRISQIDHRLPCLGTGGTESLEIVIQVWNVNQLERRLLGLPYPRAGFGDPAAGLDVRDRSPVVHQGKWAELSEQFSHQLARLRPAKADQLSIRPVIGFRRQHDVGRGAKFAGETGHGILKKQERGLVSARAIGVLPEATNVEKLVRLLPETHVAPMRCEVTRIDQRPIRFRSKRRNAIGDDAVPRR